MSDPVSDGAEHKSVDDAAEVFPLEGGPCVPCALPISVPGAFRRPRVWTVFLLCVVTLISVVVCSGFVLLVLAVVENGPEGFSRDGAGAIMRTLGTAAGLLSTMAATMVLIALAALSGGWLSPVPCRERLRLKAPRISSFTWAAALVGMLGLSVAFTAAMNLGLAPEKSILETLSRAIEQLVGAGLVAGFLTICVAPGIAEELFFRGYVQTRFAARWHSAWAVLLTSLLFAFYHMDLTQGAFAFAMGLFLGLLTERASSIVPAMVCHTVINAFSFWMTVGDVEIVGRGANIVAVVAGVIVMAACFNHVRCRPVRPARTGT
ncbi:MAG TPA: CPBP family intramembrane metalloprotease [Phycisphaerae bacterium]|nr:CPBP family intramembrane metalloprotease [Phycisphaerae bacterium]HRY70743.1 CPBP family intramembrane metalloprotease [Phycisphaerae bacterium]HSA28777.1 CPBP family intramembrane metalloprotease [Phycisphaerae bacterium]